MHRIHRGDLRFQFGKPIPYANDSYDGRRLFELWFGACASTCAHA